MTDSGRVEELYHAALERPESERPSFLDEACGTDADLRREVESLLGYAEKARRLLDTPVPHAATERLALSPGARLGPYEVRERLGAGGMGEVYRARDTRLGRDVALKVLPEATTRDPDALGRFEREARLIAGLEHPHVCALHDVGRHDDAPYLVLELVEGETLAERLERGPLPLERALRVAAQIAEALEAAHGRAIVHRDLKPGNVILSERGYVKVMDFGLARSTAPDAEARGDDDDTVSAYGTRDGVILGTAAYMSPEQVRGRVVDARADVWALGCVLYEALAGRRAFGGETISDTLAAVLEREVDWSALPETTPAELRSLLRRCLTKDRERRPRDVADVRIELEDALRAAGTSTTTSSAEGGEKRPVWRRALVPGTALLLVLLAWLVPLWSPPVEVGRSVAVLPLLTDGASAEDDYFGTGLTEDIIVRLARIPDLKVASSRSSMRYRDTQKSLDIIGEELGVATLLVGRVRRQAQHVKVTLELIEAQNSEILWADILEGQTGEIFTLQSRIAIELADRLRVELPSAMEGDLAGAPTVDPEAYDLVLRGRYLRNRESVADLVKATEYLEEATERDPRYALAWALLAEVYFNRAFMDAESRAKPALYEKASRAVERALALDDALAEAHVVKGDILAHQPPRDPAGGARELRRAIELDPRLANAHRELGVLSLRTLGRVDQAIDAFRAAEAIEPFWVLTKGLVIEAHLAGGDLVSASRTARELEDLDHPVWTIESPLRASAALQDFDRVAPSVSKLAEKVRGGRFYHWVTVFLLLSDRVDEARRFVDESLELDPNSVRFEETLHGAAGLLELFAGKDAAAIQHLERALELTPDPVAWNTWGASPLYSDFATLLGCALLRTGERDRALRFLDETEHFYTARIANGDTTIRARVGIAAVHALRGDREAAYDWLEQSIDAGFYQYAELEKHPAFESLHHEERFRAMMASVQARVAGMRRQIAALEAGGLTTAGSEAHRARPP